MHNLASRALAMFVLLLIAAGTSVSAATNDFYLNLLRRGVANFEAGQYEAAVRELDVAAFGLIESIDHFETAKTYVAIANERLGRTVEARVAAQRVLAAERIQRRFAQVTLPPEIRTAFLAVAKKVLSAPEVAALTRPTAPVPPASSSTPPRTVQQTPSRTPTQPQKPQVPAPQPQIATQNPPATDPAPVVPAPQNSSATKPEPTPQIEPPRAVPPQPKPVETKPAVPEPRKIEETIIEFPSEPAKPQPQPKVDPPVKIDPPVKVDPPKADPPKADPPKPAPVKPATQPAPRDVPARLASADKLLGENNLIEARAIYRALLDVQSLDHATLLAVGEGLYRARDFAGAVIAFERAGTLRGGEEPYRYYLAVALYETGSYAKAKRELAAALPHIEITPSVTRYRAKIEGAID